MDSFTHEDFQKIDIAAVYQQNFHLSRAIQSLTEEILDLRAEVVSLREEVSLLSKQGIDTVGSGTAAGMSLSKALRTIPYPKVVSAKTGNLVNKRVHLADVVEQLVSHGEISEKNRQVIHNDLKLLGRTVRSMLRREIGLEKDDHVPWSKLDTDMVVNGADMLEKMAAENDIPLNRCQNRWGAICTLQNQWTNEHSAIVSRTKKNCPVNQWYVHKAIHA